MLLFLLTGSLFLIPLQSPAPCPGLVGSSCSAARHCPRYPILFVEGGAVGKTGGEKIPKPASFQTEATRDRVLAALLVLAGSRTAIMAAISAVTFHD